jgi:hypothetical protein
MEHNCALHETGGGSKDILNAPCGFTEDETICMVKLRKKTHSTAEAGMFGFYLLGHGSIISVSLSSRCC